VDNTLINRGTLTTVGGIGGNALIGTTGNEAVSNFGTVTGNVDLGAGSNSFNNQLDARINSGTIFNLGAGNTLTNSGIFSPGDNGTIKSTELTGNFVQSETGTLAIDVNLHDVKAEKLVVSGAGAQQGQADKLIVSGTTDLAGRVAINKITGHATPGTRNYTIVASGQGGIPDPGTLLLDIQQSPFIDYELLSPNTNELILKTTVTYCPKNLTGLKRIIGDHFNSIQY